ncbi:hypothetical protein KY362_04900, partial [Candidatus Woesearchaeota archaeon]|nr:hypothetical protein [Candidatus Woesearchaeota archaeon]
MLAKTDNRDKIVSQLEQILHGGSDPAQVQIFAREAREAVIYDAIQAAREKMSEPTDDPFVATILEDIDPELSKLQDYQPLLESVAAIIGTAVSGPSDNEGERSYARGLVTDIVGDLQEDLVRVSEDIAERIQEYEDKFQQVTSESPNRFQERDTKTGLRKAIARAQYMQEKFGTILGIAGYRADAEEPDMTCHADALTGHEEEEREEQVPGKVTFHADDWYTARELEEQLGIDGLTVTENRQELQDQLEAAGAVQRRAAAGAPYEINAKYLHHVLPKDVRSKWELVGGRSKPLPDTERDEEEEAAEPETQRQTTPPPPPAHPDGMVEIDVAKSYTVDELTDMFGVSRNTIASRLYKRGDQLREKDAIRQRGEKHNSPLEIDGQHIGVLIPAYAQHRIKLVGESAADTLEETVKGQQRPATPPEPQAPKAKTVVECPSPDGMVSIYAGQDYSARELTGLFGLPKTSVGSNLNRKFEQLSADGKAHLREDGRNPQVIMGAYVTEVLPEKVHDRVKLVEGEAPTLEETVASEAGKTAEETKKVPPAEDGTIMLDPKAYYTMNELSEATGVKKTSLAPKMSVKKAELEQAGAVEYKDEANRTVIAVLGSYAHLVLPARVRERMQLIGAQPKETETPATEPA